MAISSAPKKKASSDSVPEDKILEVINRGGSTTRPVEKEPEEKPARKEAKSKPAKAEPVLVPEVLKRFSIELTESETHMIKELRNHRPQRGRARKISISVTDWIIEAVQEKIDREKRKYGVE
ncbi:hypothetical protein BWI93_15205 [Siphonobacter sp. BAB-5385]|uniref:hypothetical protein n=1 Tax=Siphonobacter sp. BAB-5385 TaxID=1864822 RepID=UPI000B9E31CD|nr:hypothetical protein [Siphonobacter sp. BAB-5385]OZI07366.1 hypothetical protein BWI93_15205 [Siphonobacter sp. BAB-5385]